MLAEVVILARQIDVAIELFEDHLCSADLPLTRYDADTGFQSPSVSNIIDVEEFVEVFLPIQSTHEILHQELKIARVPALKRGVFGLSDNIDPEISCRFGIVLHFLHRIGEEIDHL